MILMLNSEHWMLPMIKMVKFDICPKCKKKGLSDKNIICKYCEYNPLFENLTNIVKNRIGLNVKK